MPTINDLKKLETPPTPLFLFECTLASGTVLRWSTHGVTYATNAYAARILSHNLFEMKSSMDAAADGMPKLKLTLANADGQFSGVERATGWKGSQISVRFLFFDLAAGAAASADSRIVFRGIANPPEESTDMFIRLSFTSRLNMQRTYLPEFRIERRCPWTFPATLAHRQEALSGGNKGAYSRFYRCGYSADVAGGAGNLNGTVPFTTCDYSRAQCIQRGMFDHDAQGQSTARFGGAEFLPASVLVRSYGEKGSHVSNPVDNQAKYNDYVPLIYGTVWLTPPVIFARNDGNLTRMEVLLGAGEITAVQKVIVNGIEIPAGVAGVNMTATGWYNLLTPGTRSGAFDPDFADGSGRPLGDPYGSSAVLSVVVPNRISDGRSLPRVETLLDGLKLPRYDTSGNWIDASFTNNPAWVLLDILRRVGWGLDELELKSFGATATICDQLVQTRDLHGNSTLIPRYQCNLPLTRRRSAADVVRGIRNASALYLILNAAGKLELRVEETIAAQQSSQSPDTNSTAALNGGWPAYEFGDNTLSGILRRDNGQPAFRTWARSTADSPNRLTLEFQDEFNEYQQDSLSLVDLDDTLRAGQEVTAALTALGIPNFHQAGQTMALQLAKTLQGNVYVEFETSVRGACLTPGDLIAITWAKEGWTRQPFRILEIAPAANFRTAVISAQIHDDSWFGDDESWNGTGRRQPGALVGLPRPLVGAVLDSDGRPQFSIAETTATEADGTVSVTLSAGFSAPDRPLKEGPAIPLVSLRAVIDSTAGSLQSGQTLYYGISALDASGSESDLSFLVKADLPAGTGQNQVTLQGLSFSQSTAAFNVYRGSTPQQLLRIASGVAVAAGFTDGGATAQLRPPPDANYDHANFYWRLELLPEQAVDIHSPNTIGLSTLNLLVNEMRGATVLVTAGKGAGQERGAIANTATTVTMASTWDVEPDSTSRFVVAESAWQFGSTGSTSPVSFTVPNRAGTFVHVSGRAANVHDQESARELSPITRWRIGGGNGADLDSDVPGLPTFGLSAGQGTVEIGGIAFPSLTNTRSVTAATLVLSYWDELNGPGVFTLGAAIGASETSVICSPAGPGRVSDTVQIDSELMTIVGVSNGGATYQVTRGTHGSTAAAHAASTTIYHLSKKTAVLPFSRDFFGSPASGSYTYPVLLPDVKVAAAELFATNSKGNSDVAVRCLTGTADGGLRTLSGGQLSLQIEGYLAIQSNAVPPLITDEPHAVRDVFAVVGGAPTGAPIELRVTQNGQPYCTLTIPIGSLVSNTVNGFALGPLQTQARIGLDIVSVAQTSTLLPGSDLTVVIRF